MIKLLEIGMFLLGICTALGMFMWYTGFIKESTVILTLCLIGYVVLVASSYALSKIKED